MHANQLTVSSATVRELVDAQFPQWRGLPVQRIASRSMPSSVSATGLRLGFRWSRDVEATRCWLESEAEAARELIGAGVVATDEDPGESVGFAHNPAEFISDVRSIDRVAGRRRWVRSGTTSKITRP